MSEATTNRDIVVIGGSAGATAPLKLLLGHLPAGFPAAVFIAMHVPARGTGLLSMIMATVSPLPVRQAEDGMLIEPGHIYLAVPDRHLLLQEGRIRLGNGPRENLVRPAIDALFRSAAVAYGPRVIGVILSGMLSDGAAGLEAIKRCGGVAVVQDPEDAIADEMPTNALRAATIDVTAPAARLGDVLSDLTREPAGWPRLAPADIRLEVAIAAGERADSQVMRAIADPVPLSCPSCGGVMSAIRDSHPLRFRCQVGHAMNADVLAQQQEGAVDEAMRVAFRLMGERAELVSRLAHENRDAGRHAIAAAYDLRAHEYRHYTDILRDAVMASMLPEPGSMPHPAPE